MTDNFHLPPYTVRRSPRAKTARIVISSRGVLPAMEVVIPPKFDESDVPRFIERNKLWILRVWERQTAKSAARAATAGLPENIPLSAINETWRLERDDTVGGARLEWDHGVLKISGETGLPAAVSLLRDWLCAKAKFHLLPSLWRLADECGFPELSGVRIRCQKTIWGSCARDGMISLNCKLLFLPARLVRHVFLHELCHLREMNHSPRFHSLLQKYDGDERANAASIRDQWQYVPGWIEIK